MPSKKINNNPIKFAPSKHPQIVQLFLGHRTHLPHPRIRSPRLNFPLATENKKTTLIDSQRDHTSSLLRITIST